MSIEQRTVYFDALGLILTFALAARIGWLVFNSFRSGVVRLKPAGEFPREAKGLAFWTTVSLQLGFVFLLLGVSARYLGRLF